MLMNVRNAFIRTFKWCPGVSKAANFFPDKEVSEKKIAFIGSITLISFIGLVLYGFQKTPACYDWVIGFEEASIDELTGLYAVKKTASMDGVYNISMIVDTPDDERVRIQWFSRTEDNLINDLVYLDGLFYANGNQIIGADAHYTWSSHCPIIYKISSTSKDAVVHISIDYEGKDRYWPPGSH